jgi:UDP-N-acetylmuramate-alanine ligase
LLVGLLNPDDIVLTLGAGSIGALPEKIKLRLAGNGEQA